MSHYYILKKGVPVKVPDLMTWAHWYDSKSPDRIVETITIGDVEVSTLFFGLDASDQEPPRLYRIEVTSPDEAQAGHDHFCPRVIAGI